MTNEILSALYALPPLAKARVPLPVDPEKEAFLVELARALHAAGTPADRLESLIQTLGGRLGAPVQVLSTPTALQLAFGSHADRCRMSRQQKDDVDLGRVHRLNALIEEVLAGRWTIAEAHAAVSEELDRRPLYGAGAVLLSFALAAACAARFFHGGAREVMAAGAVGLAVGVLSRVAGRVAAIERIFTPLAAALAASLSLAIHHAVAPLSYPLVTLSSLIVLVPGLTLTVAMGELVTRHLISGTARLAQAVISFLGIGFGLALGRAVFLAVAGTEAVDLAVLPGETLPAWTESAALLVAPFAFVVLFQARWQDAGWIVAASLLGFFGARLGAGWLGPELGAAVGALTVGVFGNLLSRGRGLPAAIPQVPGIMLMVPGSIGYRSMSDFLEQQVLSGMETGVRMAMVAISLAAGLLFANALVPPRQGL